MDANKKPDVDEVSSDAPQPESVTSVSTSSSSDTEVLSAELSSVESEAPTGSLTSTDALESNPGAPETLATTFVADDPTPVLDTIDTVEAETPTSVAAQQEPSDKPDSDEMTEALKEPVTAESEVPITPKPETTPAASKTAIGLSFASANAAKKRRKRAFIFASVFGVLVIAGGVVAWQMLGKTIETVQNATVTDAEAKVVKLGVTVSLVDGTAEYKAAAGNWQKLRAAQLVSEGDSVRTGADGRTVLSFDDGSALRLDAATNVRVDSLSPDNIQVTQLEGTAYSRVVPSERTYAVTVNDVKYTAGGTAFATVSSEEEKGVQVYQSSVKVDGVTDTVAEGKQYYKQSKDASRVSKVTDISMAALEDDSFIKWNISEDKKVTAFKEKLGILANVKSVYKEETDKPAETKSDDNDDDESTVAIKLSASAMTGGVALTWNSGDIAVKSGYKLLRSSTSRVPTLGSAESMYISDSKAKSHNWTSSKSGTYWYRVCVYQGDTGKCTNYSNVIQLKVTAKAAETKPTVEKEQVKRGTMTLTRPSYNKIAWNYTGKAVHGYKIVYGKTTQPVFNVDQSIYISNMNQTSAEIPTSSMPSGKYYVKVCAYTGSTCVDYSNEAVVIKR